MSKKKKKSDENEYEEDIVYISPPGGPYICGPGAKKYYEELEKKKPKIRYKSKPKAGPDNWRVEEIFRKWGEKTDDEFADWARDARAEAELRRKFLEEAGIDDPEDPKA